jgi:non-canonical poly(A) RNA polymerase PAPD5/7
MKRSLEASSIPQPAPDDEGDDDNEEDGNEWKDDDYLAFDSGRRASDSNNNDSNKIDEIGHDDSIGYDSMEEDAMEESSSSSSEGEYAASTPPWLLLQSDYHHQHHHRHRPRDCAFSLVALHNEILQFVQLMEPLQKERETRERLIQEIQAVVLDEFGKSAKLQVLGSQATGLFLPTSDIDLTLLYEDDTNINSDANYQHGSDYKPLHKKPIHRFSDLMAKTWKNRLSYLETIEATRVPICKIRFADSDIAVDVSFNQPVGVTAAALMTEYLNSMPPLRPLTIVLKYFLAARDLNEPYSGGVGSYLLQLLIVSFLQHRERMAYHDNARVDYNLGSLLLDFLELYGLDFNYLIAGLSVRFDGFYYRKGNTSRYNCICVENPLDIAHDVGSSSYRFTMVQRSFAIAYRTLLTIITPGPRPTNIPNNSILGSILPTSPYMTSRLVIKRRDRALSAPRHAVARGNRSLRPDSSSWVLRSEPQKLSTSRSGIDGALSAPRHGRNQDNYSSKRHKT